MVVELAELALIERKQSRRFRHKSQGYFYRGGQGGACPPLNFDNPKRSRIWEAYVVVRLAAT